MVRRSVETLCCTDQKPGADSPRQRHLWEAAQSCDPIGRRFGRQRGRFCRANDAPLWAAAAPNYFDFEVFDKTIGCHSSPLIRATLLQSDHLSSQIVAKSWLR